MSKIYYQANIKRTLLMFACCVMCTFAIKIKRLL